MVDPLVGTLVLIVVALIGARFSFSSEVVPPGPRLLLRTGTHFLFVGLALGPVGLGLLGDDATRELFPFMALGLGWIGFHFGLQLDYSALRRFPVGHHVFAIGQSLLTLLLVLAGGAAAITFFGLEGDVPWLLLMVAASTAAVTTPAGIALVSSSYLVRGKVRDLIFFSGSLDGIVGLIGLQVTFSLMRPEMVGTGARNGLLAFAVGIGTALGLGLACGIVFIWLLRARPATEELMLYILGICAFAAGAALQWELSPLFISMTMGVLVANHGQPTDRVFRVLERWEKPVYVTFLLVAGALLRPVTLWVAPLALGYALLRILSKGLAGSVAARVVGRDVDVPGSVGLALIPQGGISLAMAVSFVFIYSDLYIGSLDVEATLFAAIVLGVVLSELIGPYFTIRVLRRAGEITAEMEAALAEGDETEARKAALNRSGGS